MCSKKRLQPQLNHPTPKGATRRGFSLVEIMVVVVIIGLLAGMVTVGFAKYLDAAKKNVAKSDISVLAREVKGYYMLNNRYPSNDEGIAVLKLDNNGIDPWGNPYQYNSPAGNGDAFEVYTLGEDGTEGGEGNDADIFSWQLNAADETAGQ